MSNQEGDQAPPKTRVIEYKIGTTCARCGYKDSIYNKHEFTTGVPQERSIMWRCMKCDNSNIFHYTVGKEQLKGKQ